MLADAASRRSATVGPLDRLQLTQKPLPLLRLPLLLHGAPPLRVQEAWRARRKRRAGRGGGRGGARRTLLLLVTAAVPLAGRHQGPRALNAAGQACRQRTSTACCSTRVRQGAQQLQLRVPQHFGVWRSPLSPSRFVLLFLVPPGSILIYRVSAVIAECACLWLIAGERPVLRSLSLIARRRRRRDARRPPSADGARSLFNRPLRPIPHRTHPHTRRRGPVVSPALTHQFGKQREQHTPQRTKTNSKRCVPSITLD